MKKFLAVLLTCVLMLGCACAETDEAAVSEDASLMTVATGEGIAVVSANSVLTSEDDSNYMYCYIYAEIRNDGSSDLSIDGSVQALDASGEVIDEQRYLSTLPSCIAPGETGFLIEWFMIQKTETVASVADVASISLSLEKDPYGYGSAPARHANVTVEQATGEGFFGNPVDVARVTIINDTEADLVSPSIVVAAYDADGNLLTIAQESFVLSATVRIPAGSSLIVDLELNHDVAEWLEENGRAIADLRCIVYMR